MNLVLIYVYLLVIFIFQVPAGDINIIEVSNIFEKEKQSSQSLCYNSSMYKCDYISCNSKEPLLEFRFCATYDDDTELLSIALCPYNIQPNGHKLTIDERLILPRNLSQLNDYMCGPLNRKGLVCSECTDGFGPSVTSFGYSCVKCADAWYGVPLFLLLEFAPITVLYLVILVFGISITSAPIPCFIMYAQLIITVFDLNSSKQVMKIIFTDGWDLRLDMKIILALYGLFNLDLCHYNILPPYCISSKLKPIHIAFLGYIPTFYPILLICLTWVCVELHDRNFRPLVWLWRPFHRCFIRLRRGWNKKSDIIDAFITFFLLSYSKTVYQTMLFATSHTIANINLAGKDISTYRLIVDQSIKYGGSYHLAFAIPSLFICLVFNVLPPLLLILYPIRAFQSCLSKVRIKSTAMHIFIDKVHSCYRNGLDGGRDMRSFSGLYFFLRFIVCVPSLLAHLLGFLSYYEWFILGTLYSIISLLVVFAKPYNKPYMNYLDALLHLHFAILCFLLYPEQRKFKMLPIARVLLSAPIAAFILGIALKIIHKICRCSFKLQCGTAESSQHALAGNQTATQLLIQPNFTAIRYGADDMMP